MHCWCLSPQPVPYITDRMIFVNTYLSCLLLIKPFTHRIQIARLSGQDSACWYKLISYSFPFRGLCASHASPLPSACVWLFPTVPSVFTVSTLPSSQPFSFCATCQESCNMNFSAVLHCYVIRWLLVVPPSTC